MSGRSQQRSGEFRHAIPAIRIHYRGPSLDQLGAELARAGCSRAVLVCGGTLARHSDGAARVQARLGDRCAGVFDGVKAHSPVPAVVAAAEALAALRADAVVALGGGSAVVTARAASILLAESGPFDALCTRVEAGRAPVSPRLEAPKLPQFVLPTTPTTAYAKAGSAVVNPAGGRRLTMFDPKTRAQALFFDDALMLTAGPDLVRDAALNAYAMAMQGLESRQAEPLSDASLLHALRLLRAWLPQLASEPHAAAVRGELMLAAFLAGHGSDYAPTGLASVVGHCLASRFGIAPGMANAVLLPHAIRFNAPATKDRLAAAFGAGAGDSAGSAEAVAAESERFLEALGIPLRLRELGATREHLSLVAEDAQLDWFLTVNPRRVRSPAELMPLLEAAW